jgi:hypothetical protein
VRAGEHGDDSSAREAFMNDAVPPSPAPPSRQADILHIREWLTLKREMAELHARLEYLKLMLTLESKR